ncbi:hypothetical protein AGABI1DRAFT_116121 [Agaricus bisporus var. burnettii JB137-S8]|uniref:Autophagy-related protein 3 n=1 Tax=Agaricus bisporus var. burnettii (strain JB137-S8 / ATCC MYA-4627 / FGSC 10392) TaxID=597362 RepID=K5XMT6_AGABU|nr:hypothetical protein AGABI2DRAFT_194979 [Agaricus bisporus var. bisporus H97]XP_007333487.1 uncharacterized protein AGABI1DRAFT_116121 [Agaricus bisporus var. burnettii JB137-S8]EKM75925.1 hypothetical protein AGABI1DRAFT_116121 [Agaricus bisporus var. burnettii JB137-S8]EKV44181.1 hypothetical protein AGABI2DRAFT_194979 [Agaricus bisporus var. bisporus H97]
MQALQSHLFAVREILSPVLKESKFKEHGRITPEEFVGAGDFLVYKFPVWSWESGDKSKTRDFLPADKQYLVTRGVPCLRRATSLAYTDADEDAERLLSFADGAPGSGPDLDGDEWVETHAGRKSTLDSLQNPGEILDIPDLDNVDGVANGVSRLNLGGDHSGKEKEVVEIPDLDDIPDMEEIMEEEDEATAAPKYKPLPKPSSGRVIDASQIEPAKDNLLSVRTYDVMITYDKYYQTPRVWLIGYDENRNPLTPQHIFQDISADHANKTVTIEPFIHSASLQAASVHPCKHASVMKKVIERMNSSVVAEQLAHQQQQGLAATTKEGKKKWSVFGSGGKSSAQKKDKAAAASGADGDEQVEGMRVDFYLVVFLKFIASIVPTIEVDSTTSF